MFNFEQEMRKYMPVGDIKSTERGSGARYNDGKLDVGQIPFKVLGDLIGSCLLDDLGSFEERDAGTSDYNKLLCAFEHLGPDVEIIMEAIEVFNYGEKKYARGNWMKGMKWSVPMACIARHELKIRSGQELDEESGLSHRGHIACNLIMLMYYLDHYPEGDDRKGAPESVTMAPGSWLHSEPAMAPSVHVNFPRYFGLGERVKVSLPNSQHTGKVGIIGAVAGDFEGDLKVARSVRVKFDSGGYDTFGINEVEHESAGKPVGENSGHGLAGGPGGDRGPFWSGIAGEPGYAGGSLQASSGTPLDTVQARHPEGTEL